MSGGVSIQRPTVALCLTSKPDRQLLTEALQASGLYEVGIYTARELADSAADLIITDAALLLERPDIIQKIKQRAYPAVVPVILLHTKTRISGLNAEQQELVDAFLSTPVTKAELLSLVKQLTKLRALSVLTTGVIESAAEGFAIIDEGGNVVLSNAAMNQILGLSSDQLKRFPFQIEDGNAYKELETLLLDFKKQRGQVEKRLFVRLDEFDERYLCIRLQPVGPVPYVAGAALLTVTDLTAEWLVKSSYARRAAALDQIPLTAVLVVDAELRLRFSGGSLKQLNAFKPGSWLGKNVDSWPVGKELKGAIKKVIDGLISGKRFVQLDFKIGKGSKARYLLLRGGKVQYPDPIQGEDYVLVLSDLTSLVRLWERAVDASRQEIVAKMAAYVAHHLNNIMQTALVGADLLAGELPNGSDVFSLALEVRQAARRAALLARRLAALGGVLPTRPRRYPISLVLREMAELLDLDVQQGILISYEDGTDAMKVTVDAELFETAFAQLLSYVLRSLVSKLPLELRIQCTRGGILPYDWFLLGDRVPETERLMVSLIYEGRGLEAETVRFVVNPLAALESLVDPAPMEIAGLVSLLRESGVVLAVRTGGGGAETAEEWWRLYFWR